MKVGHRGTQYDPTRCALPHLADTVAWGAVWMLLLDDGFILPDGFEFTRFPLMLNQCGVGV